MNGSGNKVKVSSASSGIRRVARAKRALMRIIMKITRWKRNQGNPEKNPKIDTSKKTKLLSRHNKWNTKGLEKHAELLREVIKQGKTAIK